MAATKRGHASQPLCLIDAEQRGGVPVAPVFFRGSPTRLERNVTELLTTRKRSSVMVWEWYADGIRQREATLKHGRLSWSEPTMWLPRRGSVE